MWVIASVVFKSKTPLDIWPIALTIYFNQSKFIPLALRLSTLVVTLVTASTDAKKMHFHGLLYLLNA